MAPQGREKKKRKKKKTKAIDLSGLRGLCINSFTPHIYICFFYPMHSRGKTLAPLSSAIGNYAFFPEFEECGLWVAEVTPTLPPLFFLSLSLPCPVSVSVLLDAKATTAANFVVT